MEDMICSQARCSEIIEDMRSRFSNFQFFEQRLNQASASLFTSVDDLEIVGCLRALLDTKFGLNKTSKAPLEPVCGYTDIRDVAAGNAFLILGAYAPAARKCIFQYLKKF
jgi:hypothetical protein